MIRFPDINPVIFSIGPFSIYWYSLSYICGILFGTYYAGILSNKYSMGLTRQMRENFVTYAVLGIIIGGRLGYVILYDPVKYFSHPIEILKTYEGGMSFHGGLLGISIATILFCRKYKIHPFTVTDLISMVAPFGIFLGRVANFVNAELYGRVTDVPWAFIFPDSDMLPRHPSQLYEAFFEGILLFILMFLSRNMLQSRGFATGMFLCLYSLFRFFLEFLREPDIHLGFFFGGVTMGQILSTPFFLLGSIIIYKVICKK